MGDDRSCDQKHAAFVEAINTAYGSGWHVINRWVFESPSGTRHDLSAADISQLDRIEEEGLFLVEEGL